MSRVWTASVILSVGVVGASECAGQQISFDRPESWAMKYFAAVSTFTGMERPIFREPGAVDLGLEADWIPSLSESQRRVGFNGTAVNDLNKVSVLGRPRLAVGLPGGFTAEVGWVPPLEINGVKPNLVAAALERPFFDAGSVSLGWRLYAQTGNVKGDFTCWDSVVSQPPGSAGNPLGCNANSHDEVTLNLVGLALTGGMGETGVLGFHYAVGATYNDPRFQVNAVEFGVPDHTRLTTHGWTEWVAAGLGVPLGGSAWLSGEAFYSPLMVKRPPDTSSRNDGLFNVRALLRFRL